MAEVILTWCRRGVDRFCCDAGYMIPLAAWTYIIARVRQRFPDTIFLLEGLGGKLSVTRALLNRAGFNWAYSELFQNYDRSQIEGYLPTAVDISSQDGLLVHFAETHDNPRLAARSNAYARMRTALCALCSCQGAFGFSNGVEWHATEKIDVHEASSLNWGAADNQVGPIRRLNALLREHPAFGPQTDVGLIQQGPGNLLVLHRRHRPSGQILLIAVNLDDEAGATAFWNAEDAWPHTSTLFDLLTEKSVTVGRSDSRSFVPLQAAQVLCLSNDPGAGAAIGTAPDRFYRPPEKITAQQLRAKILDVYAALHGTRDISDVDMDSAAAELKNNPLEFCRRRNPDSDEPRVIRWRWPRDVRRAVMVPPAHFLLVEADTAFRAAIAEDLRILQTEASLPDDDGGHFVLFSPLKPPGRSRPRTLKLVRFEANGSRHTDSPLLYLAGPEALRDKHRYRRSELMRRPGLFLATNGRGAMLRASVSWGALASRYDALLAANLNPEFPEDRFILLTRCRAWVVFQGYSQEIGDDCLKTFSIDASDRGVWQFQVPTGQGESVPLTVVVDMRPNRNAVRLTFMRRSPDAAKGFLPDAQPVQLILRPDIESRNFHDTTKAYLGPEARWPDATHARNDGFVFAPEDRPSLTVRLPGSRFVWEPEWHYSVYRALEAERGLDPHSDLFSPGYFSIFLGGHQQATLDAEVPDNPGDDDQVPPDTSPSKRPPFDPVQALNRTLNHYLVHRDHLKSVIAGYPWFLDWGRDSLIFVRGLVAAGRRQEARDVLQQFGRFEKGGTLPNMIRGQDAGNRDTSDAPLWFFTACRDLVAAEDSEAFLHENWGDRTPREVLLAMGEALMRGTANGIGMDPESGLLYSPAHFTWMDTNHPAGSPREGYPIEIQALWHVALQFLAQVEAPARAGRWREAATAVRTALHRYFYLPSKGYLSDCLHAAPGTPAAQAQVDDALRPNQLFALTLEAVEDADIGRAVLSACEELLVPGAVRSLSNREVARPLPVFHHGRRLNDPHRPYWGTYAGDEDTQRKPAYHNGTAWTWLFPSFCEAWVNVYGPRAAPSARAWLNSGFDLLRSGCIGHLPEILDGDYPHRMRGCDAQAWSVSEMLRVWHRLNPGG
jgi:glycogen debranching enzyme